MRDWSSSHWSLSLAVLTDTFPDIEELHVYLGTITGGSLAFPKEEIMGAQFFTVAEIEEMKEKLVGHWVYELIQEIGESSHDIGSLEHH